MLSWRFIDVNMIFWVSHNKNGKLVFIDEDTEVQKKLSPIAANFTPGIYKPRARIHEFPNIKNSDR